RGREPASAARGVLRARSGRAPSSAPESPGPRRARRPGRAPAAAAQRRVGGAAAAGRGTFEESARHELGCVQRLAVGEAGVGPPADLRDVEDLLLLEADRKLLCLQVVRILKLD